MAELLGGGTTSYLTEKLQFENQVAVFNGAYYRGVRESDLNLRVAKKLESYLKQRGYATGGFGKWGIGGRGTSGVPEKHGFDLFLSY